MYVSWGRKKCGDNSDGVKQTQGVPEGPRFPYKSSGHQTLDNFPKYLQLRPEICQMFHVSATMVMHQEWEARDLN